MIRPYLPHSYGVSEPSLVMNTLFSPTVLWGLMSPAEAIQFICLFSNAQRPGECQSHRSSDEISRIALMMHEEYETRKENYRLKLRGLLLLLSVEISRQVAEKPVVDYDKFIRVWNVLEEFHQDVGNSWDVPELANRCGWSNEHFSRVFSSLMGQSCSEYIRNVRMSRGARLLFDPNNSIGQIASQVGYSDERSFRRAFKAVYGVTPGRFRQQQGRNKAI